MLYSIGINKSMKRLESGFTIIETLLYVTLTVLVLAGALLATFGFVEASEREQKRTLREQEIIFVSRKLNWLLGGATSVVVSGTNVTITNPTLAASSPVNVTIGGDTLLIDMADQEALPLTSSWLKVTSTGTPFSFNHGLFIAEIYFAGEYWNYTHYVR